MRVLLSAVVYTFVLGFSLAAAYYVIGGREALMGGGTLTRSWPAIYALVAVFAALVAAPLRLLIQDNRGLLAVILGAWFGEYVVLASGQIADEINPVNAIFYWIAATGGPLQPIAATAGALLGGWVIHRFKTRNSRAL